MTIDVRPAREDDGPVLREIELQAGERFRTVGLGDVADHPPFPIAVLTGYTEAGRSWAAVDSSDQPVGYVLVDLVDGAAHVEQISVRPDQQGRGIGRQLIDHVRGWAADRGLRNISLTTFADVPWNGPLYEHLGFTTMAEPEIGPELRVIREAEVAQGLDPARRVCMRLDLDLPDHT